MNDMISGALHFQRGRLAAALVLAGLSFCAPLSAVAGVVSTCSDLPHDGLNLRSVVNAAHDGDTIDMTMLPACTITLQQGEIAFPGKALTFLGGGRDKLIIDAGHASRIFSSNGYVTASNMTLRNGTTVTPAPNGEWLGGCVYTHGGAFLRSVALTGCEASGDGTTLAAGGAVFAYEAVYLADSVVSGNVSKNSGSGHALGGGIYTLTGSLYAKRTTFDGNSTLSPSNKDVGGAAYVKAGKAYLFNSLISNNTSSVGAIFVDGRNPVVSIFQTTVTGNHGRGTAGLVSYSRFTDVASSTIAFNTSSSAAAAGIYAPYGITLQNSIVADNLSLGRNDSLYDLQVNDNARNGGNNNLITSTNAVFPVFTITACPLLGPLADNGGPTRTLAIAHNSPAIDTAAGSVAPNIYDQRGAPFVREYGAAIDIGAFEWQNETDDRIFSQRFENRCI